MDKFLRRITFLGLAIIPVIFADEGLIPLGRTDVSIYEPGQRAIVAWNGEEEVLVLSTDVRSSRPTKVLTILPLPGNPKISKGEFKSFERLERLIRARSPFFAKKNNGGRDGEGVKLIFHEKLGAHDITAVYANDYDELAVWTKNFLKQQRIEGFDYPEDLGSTLKSYFLREKKYFAFDVIDVETADRTREPIVYEFESRSFYYPLEISSKSKGVSEITLYCLTPLVFDCITLQPPLDVANYLSKGGDKQSPIILKISEFFLKEMATTGEIDSSIVNLFTGDVYLTVFKYQGNLSHFFGDFQWNRFLQPVEIRPD